MKRDIHPWNLKTKQPNIKGPGKANDGFTEDLVDPSNRVTFGSNEGKSGTSTSVDLMSLAISNGDRNQGEGRQ
jgi:hypothetical protein